MLLSQNEVSSSMLLLQSETGFPSTTIFDFRWGKYSCFENIPNKRAKHFYHDSEVNEAMISV